MEKINVFDNHTQPYDQWFDNHENLFKSEVAALKKAIPVTGKGIEIGAGTGRFADALGIKTGVEPAANMGGIAAQRGIEVLDGVAENLPLEDNLYDYAVMITVDCFLQDMPKAFAEVYRILKTEGALIIGMIDKSSPLGQLYQKKKQDDIFYRHAHFHNVAEITATLRKSGFGDFRYWQTLLYPDHKSVEEPVRGYGKGGFVVIKASKNK